MKLLVYSWMFVVIFVGIQCLNPANSLRNKRIRPFMSQSQLTTNETSTQQPLTTITVAASSTNSSNPKFFETLTFLVNHTTPSEIEPVVHVTTKFSAAETTLSKNSSILVVKSITEDTRSGSTLSTVITKANNTSFGIGQPAANHQNRSMMGNITRSVNPANATSFFPKRPLRSQTINRYLAKAKEKALGSSVASPITKKPNHVIVKRHFIPFMSLDDFVLDTDNA